MRRTKSATVWLSVHQTRLEQRIIKCHWLYIVTPLAYTASHSDTERAGLPEIQMNDSAPAAPVYKRVQLKVTVVQKK